MPTHLQAPRHAPRTRPSPVDPARLTLVLLAVADPEHHPVRAKILREVADHPGLHMREIARRLDVPPSHAQHHLRVLVKTRLLSETREAAYLRYWPTEATPTGRIAALSPDERELLRFLRRPTPFRILVTLAVERGMTLSAIATHLGIAPSTAHYHLGRLRKAGLVTQVHDDDGDRLWQADDPDLLHRLLVEYEPPPELVGGFMETWDRLSL